MKVMENFMSKISFANSKVTATLKWGESSRKKVTTENNIKECKSKWITKKKSIRNAQNNTQTTKVTNEK